MNCKPAEEKRDDIERMAPKRLLLYWLNSLREVPGALLVSSFRDLADGNVFCDLVAEVEGVGRPADLKTAINCLGARRGWDALSPLLSVPDAAERIRSGDQQLTAAMLGNLKTFYEGNESAAILTGGLAESSEEDDALYNVAEELGMWRLSSFSATSLCFTTLPTSSTCRLWQGKEPTGQI